MHALLNNAGLSDAYLTILAGKFSVRISHHKKTAAANRTEANRKKKTAKFGHWRAARERETVQLEFTEMFAAEDEQKREDEERRLQEEAYDLAEFDSFLDQNGGYLEDWCTRCHRLETSCRCYDEPEDRQSISTAASCFDCGLSYAHCQCDEDSQGSYYDEDDWYPSRSESDVSASSEKTPVDDYCEHQFKIKATNEEDEESMNKLSDKLWNDHEHFFGKNNLNPNERSTCTRPAYVAHYDDYDHGDDDDSFYEEELKLQGGGLVFVMKKLDEFGGLPNHFDPTFSCGAYVWKNTWRNYVKYVDYSLLLNSLDQNDRDEEEDFKLQLTPMQVRRHSRFSKTPVICLDDTIWSYKIVRYRSKRIDRRGVAALVELHPVTGLKVNVRKVTPAGFYGHDRCYSESGLLRACAQAKTAQKVELRFLLDDALGASAPKVKKTRFQKDWERQARRQEVADWQWYKREIERDAAEMAAFKHFEECQNAARHVPNHDASMGHSGQNKKEKKTNAATTDSALQKDNVYFTLASRRVHFKDVQVSHYVTTASGRKRFILDGHKMVPVRS